jgi:hypothetical protein
MGSVLISVYSALALRPLRPSDGIGNLLTAEDAESPENPLRFRTLLNRWITWFTILYSTIRDQLSFQDELRNNSVTQIMNSQLLHASQSAQLKEDEK